MAAKEGGSPPKDGASQKGGAQKKDGRASMGRMGEEAAVRALRAAGYRILGRNFRYSHFGEIDIVAQTGDILCFVEVKSRSGPRFGTPAEAVVWEKRRTITIVAEHFLRVTRNQNAPVRFDVFEVYFSKSPSGDLSIVRTNHIPNAFTR